MNWGPCPVEGARAEVLGRIDREAGAILDTLRALIRLRPVNHPEAGLKPPLEAAELCRERLERAGLYARVSTHQGYHSVVAELDTGQAGPAVVLEGHIDVVPGLGGQFEPRLEGGRLYGRGALDMLGSVASAIAALDALGRAGGALRGRLRVLLGADEETGGGHGVGRLAARMPRPDHVIGLEPTALCIVVARRAMHTVEVRFPRRRAPRAFERPREVRIAVEGQALHTGMMMRCQAHAAVEAARLVEGLRGRLKVGVMGVSFGDVVNRSPSRCELRLVVEEADVGRLGVPCDVLAGEAGGETDEGLEGLLRGVLALPSARVPTERPSVFGVSIGPNLVVDQGPRGHLLRVDARLMADDPAAVGAALGEALVSAGAAPRSLRVVRSEPSMATSMGTPLYRAMERNLSELRLVKEGVDPDAELAHEGPGQSDLRFFARLGVPCIEVGPAGDGAHSDDEYVDVASLPVHAKSLAATLLDLMGGPL